MILVSIRGRRRDEPHQRYASQPFTDPARPEEERVPGIGGRPPRYYERHLDPRRRFAHQRIRQVLREAKEGPTGQEPSDQGKSYLEVP